MKIIAKGRGKGKTTELIKMSAEKQIPIVCMIGSVQYIIDKAKELNLKIPRPLTIQQLNMAQWKDKAVLVDDADVILGNKLGHDIKAITINSDDYNELETDENSDTYSDSIKGLKEDAKSLTKQLKSLSNQGKHNEYIACIKALKDTMNLIHEYDWQENVSKYHTGEDNHIEVATWKQNSDGDIKDYHHYAVSKELDGYTMDIRRTVDRFFDEWNRLSNDLNENSLKMLGF